MAQAVGCSSLRGLGLVLLFLLPLLLPSPSYAFQSAFFGPLQARAPSSPSHPRAQPMYMQQKDLLSSIKDILRQARNEPLIPPPVKEEEKEEEEEKEPRLPSYPWGETVPQFEELWREMKNTDTGKAMLARRDEINVGSGLPSADCYERKFGHKGVIWTILYRDTYAWCMYCHSVWMVLEEKQVPYKVKRINLLSYGDKPDWFYRMAPMGLLPVLEVGGEIYPESVNIMKLLDTTNPDHPMYPKKGSQDYEEAEALLDLERELYKHWFIWIFESPEERGKEDFVRTLDQVEKALGVRDGPWFLGDRDPSLVDCVFGPKLERVVVSCLYWKAFTIRGNPSYPRISRLLDELDRRPSYHAFKPDYYTIITSLQSVFGRAYSRPEAKVYQDQIDGKGGAWSLPVRFQDDDLEAVGPEWRDTEDFLRQSVAFKLLLNNKAISTYMLRALGKPGRPYACALADPGNTPDEDYRPEVEVALRCVVTGLLRGEQATMSLVQESVYEADREYREKGGEPEKIKALVVQSLVYLRDRVGVPSDMTYPQAKYLRAYLNWMIGNLSSS